MCAITLDRLEEMGEFLETFKPPRLNCEETENLKSPITGKETESGIKNLPKKGPGPDTFTGEFTKHFKN